MRTAFRRQSALVFSILLAVILLIGVSFWALLDNYAGSEQVDNLQSTADTVANLAYAYAEDYRDDWNFRTNLSVAALSSETDILICDADGEVLMCARELQNCSHIGKKLSASTLRAILSGTTRIDRAASQLYGDDRMAVAEAVYDDSGEVVCFILTSAEQSAPTAVTMRTLRMFFMIALLVLALALFATPLLARRETKPLQTMAAAARQIAHGNLNVRVPTGNRAEEIEELATAFNNMAIALQNSDTARQEFVANISHELKTPMTTIAGYLDGMLDGTIPEEKHREYMTLVSSEARRLSRLVRTMLSASRLRDQGIPAEQKKPFDICEIAGQALLNFEQSILRKNLEVEVDMPEEGLTVLAEQDSVTQVLYNLLDNAVKFINEDGTLGIFVRRQGNSALVSISNTGETISSEELPLIFDRFHKTDKSRSVDRDGAGLGLYIVKTIIMAHGEDIYVTSRDGRTEFTFTLSLSK